MMGKQMSVAVFLKNFIYKTGSKARVGLWVIVTSHSSRTEVGIRNIGKIEYLSQILGSSLAFKSPLPSICSALVCDGPTGCKHKSKEPTVCDSCSRGQMLCFVVAVVVGTKTRGHVIVGKGCC